MAGASLGQFLRDMDLSRDKGGWEELCGVVVLGRGGGGGGGTMSGRAERRRVEPIGVVGPSRRDSRHDPARL